MAAKRRGRTRWDPSGPSTPNNPFAALGDQRDELPKGSPPHEEENTPPPRAPTFAPKVVVRQERKGHGGKTVTRISGILLEGPALEELVKELRRALGCSGRIEEGDVLLGGKVAQRATTWLEGRGAPRVVFGRHGTHER